jgi:hypothetical protein
MKILFFLLALANVVLFMWEFHNGAFVSVTSHSLESFTENQESILLMSEVGNTSITGQTDVLSIPPYLNLVLKNESDEKSENGQLNSEKGIVLDTTASRLSSVAPAIQNPQKIQVAGSSNEMCFKLGPFPSEQIYSAWEHRLRVTFKRIKEEEQLIRDYLVYYPASATMAESEANLKMLKDKGVKELWLLKQGAEQGQISLGVFNKEEKALILKNKMSSEGINAEIKPRYQSRMQQFAVLKGESKLAEMLDALKKTNLEVNVKVLAGDSEDCL